MKLNGKAFGLACGIIWGLAIFCLTYWFLIFNLHGTILSKLQFVYLGYSVTWYGAFIGLAWGFVCGFIGGALLAWLNNKFLCKSVDES